LVVALHPHGPRGRGGEIEIKGDKQKGRGTYLSISTKFDRCGGVWVPAAATPSQPMGTGGRGWAPCFLTCAPSVIYAAVNVGEYSSRSVAPVVHCPPLCQEKSPLPGLGGTKGQKPMSLLLVWLSTSRRFHSSVSPQSLTSSRHRYRHQYWLRVPTVATHARIAQNSTTTACMTNQIPKHPSKEERITSTSNLFPWAPPPSQTGKLRCGRRPCSPMEPGPQRLVPRDHWRDQLCAPRKAQPAFIGTPEEQDPAYTS